MQDIPQGRENKVELFWIVYIMGGGADKAELRVLKTHGVDDYQKSIYILLEEVQSMVIDWDIH